MTHRVFVTVTGFTDVERHALNTVFRLSEEGSVAYSPWMPDAPGKPRLALIDGDNEDAHAEALAAQANGLKLVWVGSGAPPDSFRVFQRPIVWPDVIGSLDGLFLPEAPLDFDFDAATGPDTGPDTEPPSDVVDAQPGRKALVASRSGEDRMYMRAKLALAGWTHADEARSGAQALEMARTTPYEIAVIEDLPDFVEPWDFMVDLREVLPELKGVVLIQDHPSMVQKVKARMRGARMFGKPPHPGKLHELLVRFRA